MMIRNRILKQIIISFLICIPVLLISFETDASIPYKTYTYSYWGKANDLPHAYIPEVVYGASEMGIDSMSDPLDFFVDKKGNMYIADTGNNRVICLDPEFVMTNIIDKYLDPKNPSTEITFNHPGGIYVTEDEEIYISDTDNQQIVQLTLDGDFIRTIKAPQNEVLPEDFLFRPASLAVDRTGRIYVVAKDTNMGIMAMNANGVFEGFLGAPNVTPSYANLFWRLFMTKEQRARQLQNVPTSFNKVVIDEMGFIYATSETIDAAGIFTAILTRDQSSLYAPVKRLNPSGVDVLRRKGNYPPVGDIALTDVKNISRISNVAVSENGVYSILDSSKKRIFTYDRDGNLLFAFGGEGQQTGLFVNPTGIAYRGPDILVLDAQRGQIVEFKQTQYGESILDVIEAYSDLKYEDAIDNWRKVLSQSSNLEMAYKGIGNALVMEYRYEEAMQYFRIANDTGRYSYAFQQYRKELIGKYFLLIPVILISIIVLIYLFGKFAKKKNIEGQSVRSGKRRLWSELIYAFHIIFHPFDGFWDLKHERRGSTLSASILIILVSLSFVFRSLFTGYIFNNKAVENINILSDTLTVLIPFILWCIANWAVSTLLDGEASFKDIYITTAYGLSPLILILMPAAITSNMMILEEGSFISFFNNLAFAWSFFLIFAGIMIVQGYSVRKNLLMSGATLTGMLIILFIALLMANLVNKMADFIRIIGIEIMYRL
ncbi:hypothetical protein EOM86_00890 [Candidatus Nomurabacteria bacterium]|nr:hypothetical protein [Candidatus Nomurabacteria bacterium]